MTTNPDQQRCEHGKTADDQHHRNGDDCFHPFACFDRCPGPGVDTPVRGLRVMEAHLAADCPDRDSCWAAPMHDEHDPRSVDTPSPEPQQGVTQTLLAGRDDGVPGNCVQAALASLLRLPIEAVPHFLLWDDYWNTMIAWLGERGYTLTQVGGVDIPDRRCIVVGRSPRDVTHVCVAEHGQIVWDPHPSRDGLVSVIEAWFIEKETTDA